MECCAAFLAVMALLCPCVEIGRMATDSMGAASAAADLARAAAADDSSSLDVQAYLSQAYPHLASASTASIVWHAPETTQYDHHLVKEDGTVLARNSTATSRKVEATVTVSRDFATPLSLLFSSLSGTSGYTVSGIGTALQDMTVQSGNW